MGEPGTVRIVGQVRPAPGRTVAAVRFSVDGSLLGTVTNGPPYAIEWTDDNPFQRREIVVEAEDDEGDIGRDRIVLEPFVVTELAEITSVLVEAGVYDKTGRMIRGLTAPEFILEEDGTRQVPDMVAQETIPTTFALLVDASQSMSRNMEFVHAAAGRLLAYLRPKDRVLVAPFSKELRAVTGPTQDRPDDQRSHRSHQRAGRHGHAGFDGPDCRALRGRRGPEGDRPDHRRVRRAQPVVAGRRGGGSEGVRRHGLHRRDRRRGRDLAEGARRAEVHRGRDRRARRSFPRGRRICPNVYDVLANDAQLRYLVTYTPTNQKRDGSWRTISLRTHDESLIVKARTGYFAPKPPPVRPVLEFTAMDSLNAYLDIIARRSRRLRGRRRAEGRDVPGGHVARVDGARARLERQHEAGERAGGGRRRHVRRGAAAGG